MPEDMDTREIESKCLDSEGFILFVGYITAKKDDKGANIIDWQYRRHHFSFADAKEAVRQFGVAINKDIMQANEETAEPPLEG